MEKEYKLKAELRDPVKLLILISAGRGNYFKLYHEILKYITFSILFSII